MLHKSSAVTEGDDQVGLCSQSPVTADAVSKLHCLVLYSLGGVTCTAALTESQRAEGCEVAQVARIFANMRSSEAGAHSAREGDPPLQGPTLRSALERLEALSEESVRGS